MDADARSRILAALLGLARPARRGCSTCLCWAWVWSLIWIWIRMREASRRQQCYANSLACARRFTHQPLGRRLHLGDDRSLLPTSRRRACGERPPSPGPTKLVSANCHTAIRQSQCRVRTSTSRARAIRSAASVLARPAGGPTASPSWAPEISAALAPPVRVAGLQSRELQMAVSESGGLGAVTASATVATKAT